MKKKKLGAILLTGIILINNTIINAADFDVYEKEDAIESFVEEEPDELENNEEVDVEDLSDGEDDLETEDVDNEDAFLDEIEIEENDDYEIENEEFTDEEALFVSDSMIFQGGDGSEKNPYQIATAEQLDAIKNDLSANYCLVSDINLGSWNWHAIGDQENAFKGTFDGNGYSINNFTMRTQRDVMYYGLFGISQGKLKNIKLKNCNISIDLENVVSKVQMAIVGAIVGATNQPVYNCEATGTMIISNAYDATIGGLVGRGNASYSKNYVNISISSIDYRDNSKYVGHVECGGIIGQSSSVNGTVENCVNYGKIVAESDYYLHLGGISGTEGGIKNCVNYGNIKGSSISENKGWSSFAAVCNVGGIVGSTSADILDDCVNFGNVEGKGKASCFVGGISGFDGYYSSGKMNNCYNVGKYINSDGVAARVAGAIYYPSKLYSIDTTLINGKIPTEQLGTTSINGESMSEKQIANAIYGILNNLNLKWSVGDSGDDKPEEKKDLSIDSDGDGIPDIWELEGADTNGDGIMDIDFPRMGANPNIPDLFIEVDWMEGLKPRESALRLVYNQFKAHGINLHVDVGADSIDFVTGKKWDTLSGGNSIPYSKNFEREKKWTETAENNFSEVRWSTFRYCLFVNRYDGTSSSGIADNIRGQFFIVADVDGWISNTDTAQAGTFMHELGHTLGLRHGGDDDVNLKPNYLSIMNYLFQVTGLVGTNAVNYSDYVLPALDENNLNEEKGIDPQGVTAGTGIGTKWYYYHIHQGSAILRLLFSNLVNGQIGLKENDIAGKALDFNYNSAWEKSVQEDLNNDGEKTVLSASINDWKNISFCGGNIGSGINYDSKNLNIHVNDNSEEFRELTKEIAEEYDLISNEEGELRADDLASASNIIASGSCGDNVSWELTKNGTLWICGSGKMTNYTSFIEGKQGTPAWYSYREKIKKIIIGNGVTTIGECAFGRCPNLSKITIPNTIQKIGAYAFQECSSLKEIVLPSHLEEIGAYAFGYCANLKYIFIPQEVSKIGSCVFEGCEKIKTAGPKGGGYNYEFEWKEYPADAFTSGLQLQCLTIPKNAYRFQGATTTYTSIKDCIDKVIITDLAQWFNIVFESETTVPTYLAKEIFLEDGNKLEKLIVPSSVTLIKANAFSGADISSLVIPENVTEIGNKAFNNSKVESVTISESVKKISSDAFANCQNLREVKFEGDAPALGVDKKFGDITVFRNDSLIIYYPNTGKGWNDVISSRWNHTKIKWVEYDNTISISQANISGITDKSYTGIEVLQTPVIKYNGSILVSGEDYILSYEDNIDIGEATLIVKGIGRFSGVVKKTFLIIEEEHSWSEWNIIKKVTCGINGTSERMCYICGKKEIRSIPATGKHIWSEWTTTRESTVIITGEKTRSCSICQKTEKNIIAKLTPTYKVNVSNVLLKVNQSTSKVKVSNLAKGDSVKAWSSMNTKIATVTKNGNIKGVKVGKTNIIITLASGKKISIKVMVQKNTVETTAIYGIPKNTVLQRGKTLTLVPSLVPITSGEKVIYRSSNKKIVVVDAKGKIKAIKPGTAKITVISGKKRVVATVTVPKIKTVRITGVKSKIILRKGKSIDLKPKLFPTNSEEKIVYKTLNKSIITVNERGKVIAKNKGSAIITIKSGKISLRCAIIVQ